MDYKQWVQLFGRTTDDKQVREALAKVGIRKPPVIDRDDTDARVDLPGMTLVFTDPALLPELGGDVGEGTGVLSGVILMLKQNSYSGSLPFKLKRDDSQDSLRARFGDPIDEDEEFRWDRWEVDGLVLNITYAKDFASLDRVMVRLPEID
jgi:hypothetical protein